MVKERDSRLPPSSVSRERERGWQMENIQDSRSPVLQFSLNLTHQVTITHEHKKAKEEYLLTFKWRRNETNQ